MNQKTRKTRRRFLQTMAGVGAGAILTDAAAAQDHASRSEEAAQRLVEVVRLRLGEHLNDEQLKTVQQRLMRGLSNAAALRRMRLENGDEPAFVFMSED